MVNVNAEENNMIKHSLRNFDESLWDNLLCDRTTGKNIIWATDEYSENGDEFLPEREITRLLVSGEYEDIIRPRISKSDKEQIQRTRKHAEVFTPAWLCNKMNNVFDNEWFGRENVFNIENGNLWEEVKDDIVFPDDKAKSWQAYVDSAKLEITCGEAPFLVSRYDAVSGEEIEITRRIGILDRKLRVVSENTNAKEEWLKWAYRAFESVYGYEYQGDNLLIARINLLLTFAEYMEMKLNRQPEYKELKNITKIISWNIWQMDGLTCTVPLNSPDDSFGQMSLFETNDNKKNNDCKIMDWRGKKAIYFSSLKDNLLSD